jgi:hypothetical protein
MNFLKIGSRAMKINIQQAILFLFIILLCPTPGMPEDDNDDISFVSTVDFTYNLRKGDSKELSKAFALFGAKQKAVALSAKYLTHKGLLEHYGKRQNEIFCLATNEIAMSVIGEKFYDKGNAYYVKIRAKVRVTDFIHAEIKNLELEKEELKLSYTEKMEQHVLETIDLGRELSRAYRYIRRGSWRIAIIYLNHLGKKYPNWGEIYLAKAIVFYSIHNVDKMVAALKTACLLESAEACKELEALTQSHDK